MLPILLSLGPIKIYSYGVFLLLALFVGLYFWWKMGRDEHWEEIELFDGYFLSLLVFFVSSRVVYVLLHPDIQTWYRVFAVLAYPGLSIMAGLVFSTMYLILYGRMRNWEVWKLLDVTAVVLAVVLLIGSIGAILNGSNPGIESSFGLLYPGETVKRLPVDVWSFVWSLVTFGVVSRVRKQFRFFSWYKGDSSVARDGLAFLAFLFLAGIYLTLLGLIDEIAWRIWVLPGVSVFGVGLALYIASWIYTRSGKSRRVDLLQWVSKLRRGR